MPGFKGRTSSIAVLCSPCLANTDVNVAVLGIRRSSKISDDIDTWSDILTSPYLSFLRQLPNRPLFSYRNQTEQWQAWAQSITQYEVGDRSHARSPVNATL